MKIIVLVKQVPDTWGDRVIDASSGRLERRESEAVIDEIDEYALEVGLSYKDSGEADVVALSMGPRSATDVLRKSLAMGADSAIHILDDFLAGADAARTATVLAEAISKVGFDLVVSGNESTDGRGGVIPAMVAEHLRVPHLTSLDKVEITSGTVSGERRTERGSAVVRAHLPAVISVTERSAEPRFPSFKGIMRAKKKQLDVLSLVGLGLDPAFPGVGHSVVIDVKKRPARTAGTKIVDQGNAAIELADFLAASRLI